MDQVNVGVIGIGFGQQVHVPAFRSDARCHVAAIGASTKERAAKVASRLGIEMAYGDWRELVTDPAIDAVAIATPPSLQPAIATAAFEGGKPVFCEKPLAAAWQAAAEMAAAADRAGLPNMVDFEFPEIEQWRQAKALLDSGRIGGLRHVAVSWSVETYTNRLQLSSWKTRTEDGGGTLNSFVAHAIFYLEWLLGPVASLAARLYRAPSDPRPGDTADFLWLELQSGVLVSLSVSTHAFLGHGHRVEFHGDEGTLVLDNPTRDYAAGFRLMLGTRGMTNLEVIGPGDAAEGTQCDGRVAAVARLAERFITWVTAGVPSAPTFRDGLRVQRLLENAQQSHRLGRWVDVSS